MDGRIKSAHGEIWLDNRLTGLLPVGAELLDTLVGERVLDQRLQHGRRGGGIVGTDQGGFDIPVNYSLGAAVKPMAGLTVALDYERIEYSGINSVGNPSSNRAPLGAANGPGFGWKDVDVIKLGVQYQYAPNLNLRAGYNRSTNPIQARDVTFNILAPGVVQDHITLGFSYALSKESDLTMAYMHANTNSVSGASMFTGVFQSMGMAGANVGTETIRMYENSLGIAYGLKLK